MTREEEKTIQQLYKVVNELREENKKFREDVTNQVNTLNKQVEKKHTPIYLETDILKSVQTSIDKAIHESLSGYSSPLTKLVSSVVESHSVELRKIISDSFSEVIKKDEFKQSIVSAFSHKVARSLINNNEGLFDKVHNELKQDSIFRARASLAIGTIVEEILKEKE